MIQKEALKYKTRAEFCKDSKSAYNAAITRGILDQICSHMKLQQHKPWTIEEIRAEALKYQTRIEFSKNSPAYQAAVKRKILDQVCEHMKPRIRLLEDLMIEALKYNTSTEFYKNNPRAYAIAFKRGILDQICSHMKSKMKYWTTKEIYVEALKFNTRVEFQKNNKSAYGAAHRRKILDSVCAHMQPGTSTSSLEKNLFNIIKTHYPDVKKMVDRKVEIKNKPYITGFDIDIFIPELNKGIEFDGRYYHSLAGLKRARPNWPDEDIKNYHKIKDEYFKSKGIEILHIKEEDWLKDPEKEIQKCKEFLHGSRL